MLKQLSSPYSPLITDLQTEIKESLLQDRSVQQVVQDGDDDLPTILAPEPAGWDKDF